MCLRSNKGLWLYWQHHQSWSVCLPRQCESTARCVQSVPEIIFLEHPLADCNSFFKSPDWEGRFSVRGPSCFRLLAYRNYTWSNFYFQWSTIFFLFICQITEKIYSESPFLTIWSIITSDRNELESLKMWFQELSWTVLIDWLEVLSFEGLIGNIPN